MDYKNISSSELADTIGVQRSNVTHVLHGRNKPSFQFIAKLLETYPEINAKWLIMGDGNMLEHGPEDAKQDTPNRPELKTTLETTEVTTPQMSIQNTEKENTKAPKTKEIERIVVFYTDQTFKEYGPSK